MKTSITMLVVGVSLMISGCQKEDAVAPHTLRSDGISSSIHDITGVKWTLARVEDSAIEPGSAEQVPWFFLQSRQNDVNGHTACNEFSGGYRLDEEHLVFSTLTYTRIYCEEVASLEDQFVQVLNSSDGYQMEGDMLLLKQGERPLAWFTPDQTRRAL